MGSGSLDVLKEANLKGAGHPHVPKGCPLEKMIGLGEHGFCLELHTRTVNGLLKKREGK